jgi:hypothetical protein
MARVAASLVCIAAFATAASAAPASRQALRTCVDRWNQANMRGWGPNLVDIAVRRLAPAEVHNVGDFGPAPRCVASIAGRLHEQTFVCVLNGEGAYECSRFSDGAPLLRRANGKLDDRGVLTLDEPLAGTHATRPLAWQRYPHVDGLIHPWTSDGKLRAGLRLDSHPGARYRGSCEAGSEYTLDRAAHKCVSDVQWDSCYAPNRHWNRIGTVLACGAPGSTRFDRFVITRRS